MIRKNLNFETFMEMIPLLVGSQMGTAEIVADEIGVALEEQKINHTINLDPNSEDLRTDLILICTSTHGAGELPDNLQPLLQQITDLKPDLSHLSYGLIGLGDRNYDTFNQACRTLDLQLSKLGATRIGERLEIDVTEDQLPEDTALEWLKDWLNTLSQISPLNQ